MSDPVGERSDPRQRWTVNGSDATEHGEIDLERWLRVAESTLTGEGAPAGSLDLIFVDEDEMADLNAQHMGGEGPTDVLSFPMDAWPPDGDEMEVVIVGGSVGDPDIEARREVPVHLGDVVLCNEVARRQSSDHAGSPDAELTLLVIHGVLHVLGHDHAEPEQTALMQDRERHHMARYGLSHPAGPSRPE